MEHSAFETEIPCLMEVLEGFLYAFVKTTSEVWEVLHPNVTVMIL
jgi:hypothetical protein